MLFEVIDETRRLALRYPEILRRISEDQDRLALGKKQLRIEEREWIRAHTEYLPGLEGAGSAQAVAGGLQAGRSRMDPETVLVFFSISHYFCSVYSGTAMSSASCADAASKRSATSSWARRLSTTSAASYCCGSARDRRRQLPRPPEHCETDSQARRKIFSPQV